MSKPDLAESIALQIADGDDVSWQDDGENSAVLENLLVLNRLAQTLRDQDETPDIPDSWGSLKIVELLGSGAYADVYRAHDPNLQRDVALKLYRSRDPDAQQRLLEEGRMMARVRHPNVVQIFAAENHDGRIGLWMELVEGQTLDEFVAQQGPMSAAEAANIGRQLCSALAAIHAEGLLYRDVKAQNVIRESGGAIKLTDFGSGIASDALIAGRISGTPLYLAPELLADADASVQSDIYALGILLYYLTTGEFPVEADDVDDLPRAHREDRRLLLDVRPGLSDQFAACVERAASPDPQQRYGSAAELAVALGDNAGVGKGRAGWTLLVAAVLVASIFAVNEMLKESVVEPPAAVQYQVDASLYRLGADGTRTRLEDGSPVQVGDNLSIELTASIPLHVHVFSEDDVGNAWGLFPLATLGHQNPLAPNRSHRLPGTEGRNLAWTVDSSAKSERIHIVATPQRDEQLEQSFGALPAAHLPGAVFEPRGVGSVTSTEAHHPVSATAVIQASQRLVETADLESGNWYRVIELRHVD